ncbi:MAG: T9SS type A sorting domain-containing protein [Flavobacteriaceae bacterium]
MKTNFKQTTVRIRLSLPIFLYLLFCPYLVLSQWTQLGNTLLPPNTNYIYHGANVKLNQSGDHMVFTTTHTGTQWIGEVRVYQFTGTNWQLKGNPISIPDYVPNIVTINEDGTLIAFGIFGFEHNGPNRGKVEVYSWQNGIWQQKGNTLYGENPEDQFGSEIGYDGIHDRLFVSSGVVNNFSGRVYIYQWNGSQYANIQTIDGVNSSGFGSHGLAVSQDASTLAVGAIHEDFGGNFEVGKVYVYQLSGNQYIPKGNPIPGSVELTQFGSILGLSSDGNTVAALGFPNNLGTIEVYDWTGSIWFLRGTPIVAESNGFTGFGPFDISANGTVLAVGSSWVNGGGTNAGNVKVYQWNSNWEQVGFNLEGEPEDHFGTNVSLDATGSKLSVFANKLENGNHRGYVKVFQNPSLGNIDQSSMNFEVYPNPSKGKVNISFAKPFSNGVLEVFDMQGRKLQYHVLSQSLNYEMELPYTAGTYVLKITMDKNTSNKKLIINQ